MHDSLFFTVGGTVQASGGTYIARAVDNQLLEHCLEGEFAFVLTARQMGKSSLMVRTAERLAQHNVRSVIVDLSQIGVQISEDAWYLGFLTVLEDSLDLETDAFDWWDSREHLGNGQRLTRFFEEVVLQEVDTNVAIFVDEIDSTLSLSFTDDFFTAIRAIYNARSSNPDLKRLTFVLIGVATPSDLIDDSTRTPFNIGRHVEVGYFSLEEALPLASGFRTTPDKAKRILEWVHKWTSGHPYLTQRLCAAVSRSDLDDLNEGDVDRIAHDTFFDENSASDSNLRFVHDMLTRRARDPMAVLTTYRDIIQGKRVLDDAHSHPITHLKLSGIVCKQGRKLRITNQIYATVFNRKWLQRQWPEHWFKRVPVAVRGLVAASFVAIIMMGLLAFQVQRTNQTRSEAALQAQSARQAQEAERNTARLNGELREALDEADSLRVLTEQQNIQLSEQVKKTESLNQSLQETNLQLAIEIKKVEALSAEAIAARDESEKKRREADSLREISDASLLESVRARTETIVIALADAALRQTRLGDPALGALLARQAWLFSRGATRAHEDPVYDALLESLNELTPEGDTYLAGPISLFGSGSAVLSSDLSANGRLAAMGYQDGSVLVVDLADNQQEVVLSSSMDGPVQDVLFESDASIIAASRSGKISRFSWSENQSSRRLTLLSHHHGINAIDLLTPTTLIAGDMEGDVFVIDLNASSITASFSLGSRIWDIDHSPDGRIVFALADGSVVVRDLLSDTQHVWQAGLGSLNTVAVHPTEGYFLVAGDSTFVKQFGLDGNDFGVAFRGHKGPVNDLAFNRSGTKLASASSDHSIQIWKVGSPDPDPIILEGHSSWVFAVDFDASGSTLLSSSNDRTALVHTIDINRLAERVCTVTSREISEEEWDRYVGADFSDVSHRSSCSSTISAQRSTFD